MLHFVLKRLIEGAATLLAASLVVFLVLEIIPGDPARLMMGLNASEDAIAALREQMGLNQPIWMRYLDWIGGLLAGDLGRSYTYNVPVIDLVAERIAVSLPLALMALALTVLIALPVGIFTASRHGTVADTAMSGLAQLGVAIPNFWFAILIVFVLVLLPGLIPGWAAQGGIWAWLNDTFAPLWASLRALKLPAGGFPGWEDGAGAALKALLLPAVALALPQAAILSRVTRSAMIEVLDEDYIRTARAKGLPRRRVLWGHALRNALIPVLTITGLQFSFLLAGTIIIENVFFLPGLGRLVFQAITQRDLIVVESVVIVLVASVVLINLLTDLAYALVDPRLRRQSA